MPGPVASAGAEINALADDIFAAKADRTDRGGGTFCEREKTIPRFRSKTLKQVLIARWLPSTAGRLVCKPSSSPSNAYYSRRPLACRALRQLSQSDPPRL